MGQAQVVNKGAWSAWEPLSLAEPVTAADLAETLDGGQAFRWTLQPSGEWLGLWGRFAARLRREPDGSVSWSSPRSLRAATAPQLTRYLDTASTFEARTDGLPWRSDPHLQRCIQAFPGIRILRQDIGEALLGFLCSATKQIVQIKQMIALLAERHGSALCPEEPSLRRLPDWGELARVSESDLRACLLGFRARYVHETALWLAERPGWLEQTAQLPYPEAKSRLCLLPGVGEKVADCVLLFGAAKGEAFPVDVWILKTLERRYGLAGWAPKQLAQFGRAHFGSMAGLAQQYLFSWERREGRSHPAA